MLAPEGIQDAITAVGSLMDEHAQVNPAPAARMRDAFGRNARRQRDAIAASRGLAPMPVKEFGEAEWGRGIIAPATRVAATVGKRAIRDPTEGRDTFGGRTRRRAMPPNGRGVVACRDRTERGTGTVLGQDACRAWCA
jgi:hypothetical protein